jgi:hypothetical protein
MDEFFELFPDGTIQFGQREELFIAKRRGDPCGDDSY